MTTNKIALITGAASGLGRTIALRFAKEGMSIIVADVNDKGGHETVELIQNEVSNSGNDVRAVFVHCDVTSRSDLLKALATSKTQFGREIDIMVNNAGVAFMPELEGEKWKRICNVNFVACIEGTLLAIEEMKRSGRGGVIINIASMAGIFPQYQTPIYAATKAGIIHFTRSLAHLHSLYNVRVCALAPSFADTPMLQYLEEPVKEAIASQWGVMSPDLVADATFELAVDSKKQGGGAVLRLTPTLRDYWQSKYKAKL